MALSKAQKTWIIILSIPVVLIIAGGIALKLYLTSDRLKALIIPRIEESTHRTVAVRDISFSVFPRLGISVEGLKISNPNGKQFEHEQFLSLERLLIDVKILPLLGSRLEVNKLILNHPQIYLEILRDGTKNYKLGTAGDHQQKDTAGISTKSVGSLLLSNFEINDGEIEYIDRKFNSHAVIMGYHQTATAETRPADNALKFESQVTIDKLSYGSLKTFYLSEVPLTADARLTLDFGTYTLTLDAVDAHLKDLPLKVMGTITQITTVPFLDISVNAPQVTMGQLLSLVPTDLLKAAKGLTSKGDVAFSLTIKGEFSDSMDPEAKGSFTVANGTIQYSSLPKSISNLTLAGTFDRPAAPIAATGIGSFGIEQLSAKLGSNTVSGKLQVTNFDDPLLSASLSGTLNMNEVKDFYPLEPGTEVAGVLKANVTMQGKVKVPAAMSASGQLEFQNVTVKTATSPRPLRNMNGTITFNNQVIESRQLAMNIGESDLGLSFTMKNYLGLVMEDSTHKQKPNASITLVSKQLRTADLISGSAVPETPAKKSTAKTASQGGLLPGFDIDASVTIGKLVTEKFDFDNAHGALSLANGIITLKNFSVNAFQGTVISKGVLDFSDPKKRPFSLDLDVHGVDAHAALPKFTSVGNNLFGKFTSKIKLQGNLDDTLGLDPQALAGNGTVQIADGKAGGVPLAAKIADLTGLNELREIGFKNWSNSFTVANGRVNISDLRINAGSTDFLVNGSQGLDGSLDYSMTVKLPGSVSDRLNLPGIAGELVQFLKDKDGRVNLSFLASGSYSQPAVKLDTRQQQDLAKKALLQKGDEAKKKVEDELKKKAEDVLKKLFKRP